MSPTPCPQGGSRLHKIMTVTAECFSLNPLRTKASQMNKINATTKLAQNRTQEKRERRNTRRIIPYRKCSHTITGTTTEISPPPTPILESPAPVVENLANQSQKYHQYKPYTDNKHTKTHMLHTNIHVNVHKQNSNVKGQSQQW